MGAFTTGSTLYTHAHTHSSDPGFSSVTARGPGSSAPGEAAPSAAGNKSPLLALCCAIPAAFSSWWVPRTLVSKHPQPHESFPLSFQTPLLRSACAFLSLSMAEYRLGLALEETWKQVSPFMPAGPCRFLERSETGAGGKSVAWLHFGRTTGLPAPGRRLSHGTCGTAKLGQVGKEKKVGV